MYGNYGFWSWLRYRWLDTENHVTLMLMDKPYHDYDYTEPKRRSPVDPEKRKIWSAEKLAGVMSRLVDPATGKRVFASPTSVADSPVSEAERIQRVLRSDKGLNNDI